MIAASATTPQKQENIYETGGQLKPSNPENELQNRKTFLRTVATNKLPY